MPQFLDSVCRADTIAQSEKVPSPWPLEDLLNEASSHFILQESGNSYAQFFFQVNVQLVYNRKRCHLQILAAQIVLAGITESKACSVEK